MVERSKNENLMDLKEGMRKSIRGRLRHPGQLGRKAAHFFLTLTPG